MSALQTHHSSADRNPAVPGRRDRQDRIAVRIPGKFMLPDKREYDCAATSLSPRVLEIESAAKPVSNDFIVLYLRGLGRVSGWVSRITPAGFDLVMEMTAVLRVRLETHMKAFVDRQVGGAPERRHERIYPLHRFCVLKLQNNEEHVVQLVDVSLSGTAFLFRSEVLRKLPVGAHLSLGARAGRLVRKNENVIGVEFDHPLDASEFNETIVL